MRVPWVLRRVEPTTGGRRLARAFARLSATRPVLFASRHVGWKLDPWLLRASGGRLSSSLSLLPVLLLETTGARSGRSRQHAVIYFHDGDDVIVVASHAGRPTNPSWLHNLRANPCVLVNGCPMHAAEVTDEPERARLWPLADLVYPPYATYRRLTTAAGRTIAIVRLTTTR